jgi:reverse transcriptase-like protein
MSPDWLKFKKYPHIGRPLTKKKDTKWVVPYVTKPNNIAKHKFTPLLHKKIFQRKYRPVKGAPKNIYRKRQRTHIGTKERPIYYASHLDSIVYSYYSHLLTAAYEKLLQYVEFNSSPVAYRKIPIGSGRKGNKSNIEFAFDTFKFIEENKDLKLTMIVADITSFFDNLDHKILHKQWKRVLEVDSLPPDHYTVYKSLTVKRYVNETDLFNRFSHKLIVQRGEKNNSTKKRLRPKSVKHIWNLRKEKVVAYCYKEDFFKEATDLIRTKKACSHQHQHCRQNCEIKGIPQGTPMSAALANIYMLDFDKSVYEATKKRNAYYQRYSDDLIIVCDQEDEKFFYELIRKEIEETAKLEIQREKTNIYRYEMENGEFAGGIVEKQKVSRNKQLEYLGFEYDGKKVKVKTVGFSKFYRSMKRSFRRGIHFASKPENRNPKLFEERLYKRFSYKGAQRRMIWKPDASSDTGYSPSKEYHWGNYISYLEKANKVMKPINGDDTIRNQYSRFWPMFGKEMKQAYKEIGKKIMERG